MRICDDSRCSKPRTEPLHHLNATYLRLEIHGIDVNIIACINDTQITQSHKQVTLCLIRLPVNTTQLEITAGPVTAENIIFSAPS